MNKAISTKIDLVREFRLRRWARKNYVAAESRLPGWHPVVLDEMYRRDSELENRVSPAIATTSYVPLPPSDHRRIDRQHALPSTPNLMQSEIRQDGKPQHSRSAIG